MKLLSKDLAKYRKLQWENQNGICPICELYIPLEEAALDHDHELGNCRQVLHLGCNRYEGIIKKAFTRSIGNKKGVSPNKTLKNLVEYLLEDYTSNPIHPTELTAYEKELKSINKRLKSLKRESVVLQYKERAKELRKLIKEDREKYSWKIDGDN